MSSLTATPRTKQAHTPYCTDKARHDGQCTGATVTATTAGGTVHAWLVGDKGGAPEVAVDGLRALDGHRLSLADLEALMEGLLVLAYDMDRAIDEATR